MLGSVQMKYSFDFLFKVEIFLGAKANSSARSVGARSKRQSTVSDQGR